MISPEIISYIKSERSKNVSESIIKSNLISNGWTPNDVDEAFASLSVPLSTNSSPIINFDQKAYQKKIKWTIFLFPALLSAFSFFTQLFTGPTYIFSNSISTVLYLLAAYLAASIVSRGARPRGSKWKNILDFILRLIGAIVIYVFMFFALLFATCIFMIGTGGGL